MPGGRNGGVFISGLGFLNVGVFISGSGFLYASIFSFCGYLSCFFLSNDSNLQKLTC